jgi:hypothetical protein
MGLVHGGVRKDVFVDGYEWEDAVDYRNNVFLPI